MTASARANLPACELSARFTGVGNAGNRELGSAALVIERNDAPLLLIDCGPETLDTFADHYVANRQAGQDQALPTALFITHTHLDHVGGLENLFYRACFSKPTRRTDIRLFVPAPLVAHLHQRIADYPNNIAEGGVNFWDVLRIVPVQTRFWLNGLLFHVWPVRHHAPNSAFGLHLPGAFFYSGDTLPVPELMSSVAAQGEIIFHDCAVRGNPSHTGLDDVQRDYDAAIQARMIAYHYASIADADTLAAAGLRAARRHEKIDLPPPGPAAYSW